MDFGGGRQKCSLYFLFLALGVFLIIRPLVTYFVGGGGGLQKCNLGRPRLVFIFITPFPNYL